MESIRRAINECIQAIMGGKYGIADQKISLTFGDFQREFELLQTLSIRLHNFNVDLDKIRIGIAYNTNPNYSQSKFPPDAVERYRKPEEIIKRLNHIRDKYVKEIETDLRQANVILMR